MDNTEFITSNITSQNKEMEILRKHFPHCFDKNGDFQFEKFKQDLSEKEVSFSKESYSMDWLGKSYARLLASDAAKTLLKEDTEHNEKEENQQAENLLIKGDNLEVLKHLTSAYYEKVKMIYIDPPYNTGGDGFVYQDDRKFTAEELQELAGIDEERAQRILDFTQSKSNSHSAWLTFMYPRLYVAKQLLREDGVIFISIDDNEVAQLKLLMDEIFGEENFVAIFSIITGANQSGDGVRIQKNIEYCVIYSKVANINPIRRIDKVRESYRNLNDAPTPLETREDMGYTIYYNPITKDIVPIMDYDKTKIHLNEISVVYADNENLIEKGFVPIRPGIRNKKLHRWRWGIDTFHERIKEIKIFQTDNEYIPRFKQQGLNPPKNYHNFSVGTLEIKKLFEGVDVFNYPKGSKLLMYLISIGGGEKDLFLDFFSGSGTTGDAVMQLNAEDGGNRKYILVQLPEILDAKKDKAAYDFVKNELGVDEPTVFEITKERLLRAAKKINGELDEKNKEIQTEIEKLKAELPTEETQEKIQELEEEILQNSAVKKQNVFKVFETQPIWEDYEFEAKQLDAQTTLFDESKLTEDDIQSLLTTWKTNDGMELTESLQPIDLSGYTGYFGDGKLYLMDQGFSTENLKEILLKIDGDKSFNPTSIIAFGYHFESKNLREIAENVRSYSNKKNVDVDFIVRY